MNFCSVAISTAFIVTLVAVLVLALLPVPELQEFGFDIGFENDRVNHASAFATLAALGALGWPRRIVTLVIFLALVGAAIEVLQGTTLIDRDLDMFDWVADCIGIAGGLVVALCVNWVMRRKG
ncbi:hypothetical protein EFV37_28585 [Mesorhizobium loti]|jgi:predicted ABC-type sugar transport system permease subunit|uniref:Uncharacterized protein n=1 Tax=Mesorhizobium jarvisii TaxID=1777867 RepID=A0A6M7TL90_9HYPH|nr:MULTISPECIES: hypothetical protein [Mesorhizobium]ANN60222.1 hypothetical protein A9174_28310 [Mesorhizobium loti NZP2037]OBQ68807.1 hypothetical protein A9K72_11445 [Mesorhizobium loti]QKC65774.1 hypothetical protein EB229_28575 [Mesorhizobium jarvisii]QKD11688.1 hypothetical protein EFV37_28585 [Mesorhizobium loti]RJT37795.1 hypothetical protein D3242_00630 [Mesorhizobium jarvisii]